MSRTNRTSESRVSTPVKKYIEFKGAEGDGFFSYYDKETKTNTPLPFPFSFLMVDERHTIKGWDGQHSIGCNEVKDLGSEILKPYYHTKDKNGKPQKQYMGIEGLWKDIKDQVTLKKGGYRKSLYISFYNTITQEYELANLMMKKSVLQEFIALTDNVKKGGNSVFDALVIVSKKDIESRQNGTTRYCVPIFQHKIIDTSIDNQKAAVLKADQFDLILQDYFKARDNGGQAVESKRGAGSDLNEPAFEEAKPQSQEPVRQEEPASSFVDMGDDDNNDLPF